MEKKANTKRALLAAVLALVVSISMLVGTTFAWFTDSVSSANNKIVSGNLAVDLELYSKDSNGSWNWNSVKANNDPIFTYANWEPGYVDAKLLKVENEGSLALKWKAVFVSENPLGILADVIDVYVKEDVTEDEFKALTREDVTAWTNAGTVREFVNGIEASTTGTLEAYKSETLGIALKMRESAGNDYMNETIGAFDIKILATQLASEDDSFGIDYDALADYDGEISNAATLQAAFNQGGTFKVTDDFNVDTAIELGDNDVALDLNGKSITATSDDGYVIMNENGGNLVIGDSSVSTPYSMRRTAGSVITGVVYTGEGSTTTVNGSTYNATEGSAYVFLNSKGTLIINNATINGGTSYPIYSYNANNKLVINDVTINATFGCVNAYGTGGVVEINGGTFNMTGVQGKTSHIAYFSTNSNVTINGGNFNKIGDINMSSTGGGGICAINGAKLTIKGGNFSGDYADVYNWGGEGTAIAICGGNFKFKPAANDIAADFQAIAVEGGYTIIPAAYEAVGTYKGIYKDENGVLYVYTAEGFENLNKMFADDTAGVDAKVELMADIDMTGKNWNPVDGHYEFGTSLLSFNGNGHTVSNLTINGQAMFTRFAGLGDVTIKDVTFDNAKVNSNGNLNTAILVAHTYNNVVLDNVDVKNSEISGGYKVAPFIGTVYNESASAITATLKNCDVSDTVVKATSYDFCTAGMVAFVYEGNNDRVAFENCTVTDVQLMARSNGYYSHAAIYVNDADTDDCFNEVDGVTVTNVTFENI